MKNRAGFSLIELVLVSVILMMMFLIAMVAWRNHINKARDAQRKDDLQRLSVAFEEYFSDKECYPPADILQSCGGSELSPYLDKVPCDPVYKAPYCYITDADNPTCFRKFRLLAALKNFSDPVIQKLGCSQDDVFCGWETECAVAGEDASGYNYGLSSGNIPVLNPAAPSPSPSPSASPGASASPLSSPHPGGGTYIYACDRHGLCNSWDHYPVGCYFFEASDCNNSCGDSRYRCIE
jgi:type II secretory pathway pseudopilin PulG